MPNLALWEYGRKTVWQSPESSWRELKGSQPPHEYRSSAGKSGKGNLLRPQHEPDHEGPTRSFDFVIAGGLHSGHYPCTSPRPLC